uniref:SH3 domain binding glutamate rich protein like 2 n=2 Tax=Geospiza parvula TaxID=87175 RepID=A0A8C3NEE8_GEOPR
EQPELERGAALLAGGAISGVAHLDLRAAHLEGGTSPSQPLPGARWQRQPRALGRAGCGKPPFRRQLGAGRLLPGSLPAPCYGCPRPGRTTAPVGPCAPPTPPRLSPLSLPPASREPDPARPRERGCAARHGRARQGRAGPGRARGASTAGGGHARGRRRGGAGRPRPRPVRGSGSSQPRCPVPSAPVAAAHEVKMVIRVFVASSSGSVAIKKRQQDVVRFLEANRIEFEEVDITMSEEKRQWMYKNIPEDRQPAQGNPLPPQIFSDDRYCGDYDGFFESKESNTVFSFLGLKPTLASKESEP